jgi:hypothetical protein
LSARCYQIGESVGIIDVDGLKVGRIPAETGLRRGVFMDGGNDPVHLCLISSGSRPHREHGRDHEQDPASF